MPRFRDRLSCPSLGLPLGSLFAAVVALMALAPSVRGATSVSNLDELITDKDAITVFWCDFGEDWDVNYDGWPDSWRRDVDAEHPRYVEMKLVEDEDATAGCALRVRLDGAKARVFSPPMRVAARFSYQVEVKLKTRDLVHSRAWVAIDFLDSRGRLLQSVQSDPIEASDDWSTVKIDAVRPTSPRTDRAMIRIETDHDERGDINGVVSIGSIVVSRLPSMDVTTNSPFNVYSDPSKVIVTCSLSGIGEQDPLIRFQLLDATSSPLGAAIGEERLDGRPIGVGGTIIHQESRQASDIIHGSNSHRVGYEGEQAWHPPLEGFGPGFYHVRVEMIGKRSQKVEDWKEITLAIVPLRKEAPPGEFGWTLPTGDNPLPFDTLQELLPQAGLSWVKMPVWFEEGNAERGEEILRFVEQLSAQDIEAIGVLEAPGGDPTRVVGEPARTDIAALLSADPSLWQPELDHLMTRLSLRIRWWQFGFDHDTSFVGYEDLVNKISSIRNELYRFGQDVRVGLGWRWDTPPETDRVSWEFEQMSSAPALNAEQLNAKLTALPPGKTERWVLIEPTIDGSRYKTDRDRLDARIREMVHQIIIAKWRGVPKIFIANPFSAGTEFGEGGLMKPDGTPGDLLLPWRTTAQHLSGAVYVGELNLPNGSQNWVFQQGDSYLMVAWNDKPTEEVLYLGQEVQLVNVWGQTTKPNEVEVDKGFRRQVIPVGKTPVFVLGVNGSIARWRMALQLDRDRVPSVFGEEHSNALTTRNPFRQGVGGSLAIFAPKENDNRVKKTSIPGIRSGDEWRINPDVAEFSAAPGGAIQHPFTIHLKDATFGRQPLRIDFNIAADQQYRFSVWRDMQVGLGEVGIGVRTELDESGRLVVHQRMINHTDRRIDFRCQLTAKGRRRQRAQVFQLGGEGDDKTYTYPNGEELYGVDFKLRAEEVNGSRVIVHKFRFEP